MTWAHVREDIAGEFEVLVDHFDDWNEQYTTIHLPEIITVARRAAKAACTRKATETARALAGRLSRTARKAALMPEILRLYGEGVTVYTIAKSVGVNKTTVARWLKEVQQ